MLWTAQGAATLAYATEQTKGRLFATFWGIFNLGAVLGGAIELGLTYDSTANSVSNSVYAAFLVITSLGSFVPFLLVRPGTMVRTDGTRVVVPVHPSWKSEFHGLWVCLRSHPWIVLLFPFFLASNWVRRRQACLGHRRSTNHQSQYDILVSSIHTNSTFTTAPDSRSARGRSTRCCTTRPRLWRR